MPSASMQLKILLPFKVFAEKQDVLRIVAESRSGAFGLLPNRLDCAAALVPGILTYETRDEGEVSLPLMRVSWSKPATKYWCPYAMPLVAWTWVNCIKPLSGNF